MVNKYRHILTLLLTALLAVGNVMAQVQVGGSVYGGGNEGVVGTDAVVEIKTGTVEKDVYGGGNKADVSGNVSVTMTGGTVNKDVYGGGALANTNIGNVTNYGTDNETISSTSTNKTTVNLLGGIIKGDAYGGGLGRIGVEAQEAVEADPEHGVEAQEAVPAIPEIKATVYGDITVNLGDADESKGATAFYITEINTGETDDENHPIKVVNSGRVFGCNNLNGSPQGNVMVSVYKTVEGNVERTIDDPQGSGNAKRTGVTPSYEVAAVYGGGNLASYEPQTEGKKIKVDILTCDISIESVYGGGNAAPVPETDVLVFGAYEIGYVFGGGNGKDKYTLDGGVTWNENLGADVNGDTKVKLQGGYIHEAYGGSNERGTVRGKANLNTDSGGCCELDVVKLVGAGKNADIDGDAILVLGCMPEAKVDEIYGGADNANVNGNVELTITSGNFGQVFGGNNRGGIIKGHIILNIEETGCRPINIDELYLGGNEAAYSIYGYYDSETTDQETGKPIYLPRASETDHSEKAVPNPAADATHSFPYANPVLNVISFTHIGEIYGGGLGSKAMMYGNPTVNINQVYGKAYEGEGENSTYTATATTLGAIGNVYGGGNEAEVIGGTTVNIGTETTVDMVTNPKHLGTYTPNETSGKYEDIPVVGVNITGDVYGGGNEANITGNAKVNICAKETNNTYASVTPGDAGVTIGGNVFGGGKGVADNFTCDKAMVGVNNAGLDPDYAEGNTSVIIGNGTVGTLDGQGKLVEGTGNVYGGGKIGRVEMDASVTIGLGDGDATVTPTSSQPIIIGDVFAAGKGLETHGYAALVRGNPSVTVQGNAEVRGSVYGGGEIASVARYDVSSGVPVALALINGKYAGNCTVVVRGYAVIGTTDGGGNVFGAGRGMLPDVYTYVDKAHKPKRMMAYDAEKYKDSNKDDWDPYETTGATQNVWEYFPNENKYIEFIRTQALSSQTDVTISGNAIIKGSVYGGSENGIVQYDTKVKVTGGTIGTQGMGGANFGNVYGGGKGYVDATRPNNILAGVIRGNTNVTIEDGTNTSPTIYHNIYGGGAYGSVGNITFDEVTYVPGQSAAIKHMPTAWEREGNTATSINTGKATITITGGTIGTTGEENGMVFGSSRGDVGVPDANGIDKNDSLAWVYETKVVIGGEGKSPTIKGSVYGSGENGHVFNDALVEIHSGTIGIHDGTAKDATRGNVYGGGCGEDTYTVSDTEYFNPLAGIVLGNAKVTMDGGALTHNIYGAGALGSVGSPKLTTGGKTTIEINGGRVGYDGNDNGNIYGAARGKLGATQPNIAQARETEVTVKYATTPDGDDTDKTTALVAGSVFGGGQAGIVRENVVVNIEKGLILHDVYGGGALADTQTSNLEGTNNSSTYTTQVNLKGGTVRDIYGGGLGQLADTEAVPAVAAVEAKVYGDVTVTTTGGRAERVFGCNNLNGAPQGTVAVNINGTYDITGTNYVYAIGNVYGGGNQAAYSYDDADHPLTVTMAGGTVNNIFGGGLSADVLGSIEVNVIGGEVVNDVYGGGALARTNTGNWDQGGEPDVKYVVVSGLTIGETSVAGYYLKSNTEPATYTLITESDKAAANTTYYKKMVGGTWATDKNPSTTTGTGEQAVTTSNTVYTTTVDLSGGIVGNVYGGGLGDDTHAANVYGDVMVTINSPVKLKERLGATVDVDDLAMNGGEGVAFTQRQSESFTIGTTSTAHTVSLTGHVFGCNNINGTPTGHVKVYVYSTRQLSNGKIIAGHTPAEIGNENEKYEIQGVYGGGNLADYLPADGKNTIVWIDGCNITSIKKVYGGGNSAMVPATDVQIYGSHAIGYGFGGGNGGEYVKKNGVWQENDGAIVIGTASIACKGGKIGSVFGGSDAKGVCGGTHIDSNASGSCPLKITRIYGAGNEADVNGNVNTILSGCTSSQVEFVHGGSYNAHITGNVTLTITSGILQNVYGGNDARGSIGGDITVNIEESEDCMPIIIQNLVGGGNSAPYPGTKRDGTEVLDNENKLKHGNITVNVKSATRIDNVYGGCFNAEARADCAVNINMLKGKKAGGSIVSVPNRYYDDNKNATIPNITYDTNESKWKIENEIGTIGNVYGGGKEGKVNGNTTVNIGTATTVGIMARDTDGKILNTNDEPITYTSGQNMGDVSIKYNNLPVLGAHITGNVYGGGELADVTGNTFVNICAQKGAEIMAGSNHTGTYNYTLVDHSGTTGFEDITIAGSVFGGGKGLADTFTCEKAMVGEDGKGVDKDFKDDPNYLNGNTNVAIGNGTVDGDVFGGGEIARVEKNTTVTIGLGDGDATETTTSSKPIIKGDVFGAGRGVETHGYSALVRGNPSVTVQGNAKVRGSVYGGGQIGSVARYRVPKNETELQAIQAQYPDAKIGMPIALANTTSGNCKVTIKGYAEIGPDNMKMNNTTTGKPDDKGHVFGAGKGVLPKVYSYTDNNNKPKRMLAATQKNSIGSNSTYEYSGQDNIWEYYGNDADYHEFIETLALSSKTEVTISGNAFVKGSVYGGSENGIVQYDTHVTIQEHCQIGCGANTTNRYEENLFIDPTTTEVTDVNALAECDHWPYGKATNAADRYKPYDKFASDYTSYASTTGDDGHTFYGNVFGGGSGYFPYAPGKWHWEAGAVRGNTVVDITGGHILTNVYGGNEMTNVGKSVSETDKGKCTINFGGTATLGVPRTLEQIKDHPVTCYLFGGGKGDQRIFFNKQTNVNEVVINVTGGTIYGSVFGGGEDGHVMRNVKMTIGNDGGTGPTIGTWGTSYVDGNVFGGGRGFGGDAYTAGNVGGSIDLKIKGGTMLGSIYGGGRLGSVGYGLYESTETDGNKYGEMQDDGYGDWVKDKEGNYSHPEISGFKRGYVEIEISGGTIGNNIEYDHSKHDKMPYTIYENNKLVHTKGGNVFAGGMGRRMQMDGVTPITSIDWLKLGNVKSTKLTISGGTIKSNVYGGGEFGEVLGYHTTDNKQLGTEISITGGTIGTTIGSGDTAYDFGSVFGGGMGEVYVPTSGENSGVMDKNIGGDVKYNTSISMSAGKVNGNVYGGGELGSVGTVTNDLEEKDTNGKYKYKHIYSDATSGSDVENLANAKTFYDFGLGWPYEFIYNSATGLASVSITGSAQVSNYVFGGGKGKIDIRGSQTDNIVTHRYDEVLIANVRETQVTIATTDPSSYVRTVYGGGEDGHVYENTNVIINDGAISRSVFGGGKGTSTYQTTLWDPNNVKEGQLKQSSESVYSWTAGRVYGNTTVTMNGGSVGWFIYGGGNLASVGVGSYSGGKDDYSTVGYGELPSADGDLWTTTSTAESETKDMAYHFLNSGIATVNLLGGTVGTVGVGDATDYDDDGIPHGSVFGGSRGKAAASCKRSPRYRYVPDFFLGYVNKAIVNIGDVTKVNDDSYAGPTIYGSIYGGGQDGHVRNSTEVKIYKGGVLGMESDDMGRSGNVFGAGSGIGTYLDGADKKVNNSSGSVTCTTLVEVNGGTIKGSVYGGGALASVGPPKTGGVNQTYDEKNTPSGDWKSYSYSQVNIKGGRIGGNVFAASRGPGDKYLATKPHFDTTNGEYDATKYATDIWSNVHISGGKIGYKSNDDVVDDGGSVYGGGETGQVKCGVTVNITGGEIAKDVYGGGALAHTNTSVWVFNRTNNKYEWTDAINKTAKYTTTVNLLGGTIHGDAYGGGLGRKEYGTSSDANYVSPVEATVYGDVKVNLNGLETADYDANLHGSLSIESMLGGHQLEDDVKGTIVKRVFGCNNLNGSPQGAVRVHVFATQNANKSYIADKYGLHENKTRETGSTSTYDVAAVYGGGNLAAYTPMGPEASGTTTGINGDYKNTENEKRSEVIIDGCHRTSIKQVYGGGNAAPVPAAYLEVNGTYEIEESFGGGNGADNYSLLEGSNTVWYENPGANVGYENYTHKGDGNGSLENPYKADDNDNASTAELRRTYYRYGTGVATSSIKGGKIHFVYGGSNKKGNISTTALSMLESMIEDCPIDVDESYGGSKDAIIDGVIDTRMQCAHGVKEVFGGSMNADVNSDVVLTITNGSSLERVFGGNNTSGAIEGSITVNIEEGGCEPIIIKELYAGGYLAPYSIYGYEKNNDDTYKTEPVAYLDENNETKYQTQRIPLTTGENPKKDPRINVISATRIDNIFGGGYQAKVVGNPHVNVNMTNGKVEVSNTATTGDPVYEDVNGNSYDAANVTPEVYYVIVDEAQVIVQKVEKTEGDNIPNNDNAAYTITENGKTYVYKNGTTCYKVADVVRKSAWTTLPIGTIGTIYGGGNLADIYGNTYVEIGTGQWLKTGTNDVWETEDAEGNKYTYEKKAGSSEWKWYDKDDNAVSTAPTPARNAAHITGNVFGGGKGKADNFLCDKAMIGEDGKGVMSKTDFTDNPNYKDGNTSVIIANGTVKRTLDENGKVIGGNVYGGGEIGRVEKNSMVTIGLDGVTDNDKFKPVIEGDVFGGGKGVETHGYSALLRGNPTVIIQGNAKVKGSVYGGGEIASVARYKVVDGNPVALANTTSGNCKVIVRDNAEIGPDDMQMKKVDEHGDPLPPDDKGHVFGAGKGVLPKVYAYGTNNANRPKRMLASDTPLSSTASTSEPAEVAGNKWEYFGNDADYHKFIETLALSSQTDVTIGGNAFVKGSVYGGSENGIVQYDTHVTIEGNCQIGAGEGKSEPYSNELWTQAMNAKTDAEIAAVAALMPECAHWDYGKVENGKTIHAPYDPFAETNGTYDYTKSNYSVIPMEKRQETTEGGRPEGSDGHTYYGNVFGGGSGVIPYAPGLWHRAAGVVRGNTVVDITGGHILTSVYGGNEHTDVGTYTNDAHDEPIVPKSGGKCTINMVGGTLGVPRTLNQIAAHPVSCYLFGAGKGDQRIFFNTWTNIIDAEVNIGGNARIYGSVFGGGEDGHVIRDAVTNIGGTVKIGTTNYSYPSTISTETPGVIIGTTGTSYVDGNVFGAGRGFSGDALTAGSIGGNVTVNISNGTMLGSVYGGGRLASVGIGFNAANDASYGSFTEDDEAVNYTQAEADAYNAEHDLQSGDDGYLTTEDVKTPAKTYGHVTVNISGGTIGNDKDSFGSNWDVHTTGGNVFGGSMGRLVKLDGETYNPLWPQLGQVKTATVNISGDALIKSNVYGGGEFGTVRDKAYVTIGGVLGADKTTVTPQGSPTINRDVYGGGYGSTISTDESKATIEAAGPNNTTLRFGFTPMIWAGCVGKEATVNISGGWVKKNVYGGGEMASVGIINCLLEDVTEKPDEDKVVFSHTGDTYTIYSNIVKHADVDNSFALSWPYELPYIDGYNGETHINVTGGLLGDKKIGTDNGDIYGGGKGIAGDRYDMAFCANVGSSEIIIEYPSDNAATPENYNPTDNNNDKYPYDCITGAVYGGGENGHVMGDTDVKLINGLIAHSLYGGGSGKGKYKETLLNWQNITDEQMAEWKNTPLDQIDSQYKRTEDIYSITAGKVYGNTHVTMSGGYVIRNVYGGGTLGSVGKGNYTGGANDYSIGGFGETILGNLWNTDDNDNVVTTSWQTPKGSGGNADFLGSGIATVTITGGTVGYINPSDISKSMKDGLPYGNVFGGCRGEAAPNVPQTLSPRYKYCPEFFMGYVNESQVTIGDEDGGPTILGSVYGGGQDGHVRRDTHVIINDGEIGIPYNTEYINKLKAAIKGSDTNITDTNAAAQASDIDNVQWLFRGNIYGSGSGIGTYTDTSGEHNSTSSGSVTGHTLVEVMGGTIYRNVYGGGSLSSIGPPPVKVNDAPYNDPCLYSRNQVNIKSKIGHDDSFTAGYGGHVFGASRGEISLGSSFASSLQTRVNIMNGAHILGNVFGGGDNGVVKKDAEVFIGEKKVENSEP